MKWFNKLKNMTESQKKLDDFLKGRDIDDGSTLSGVCVTEESAMTVSAVFACVRTVSEDVASLPLSLYKRLNRGKDKAADHPLYYPPQMNWKSKFV